MISDLSGSWNRNVSLWMMNIIWWEKILLLWYTVIKTEVKNDYYLCDYGHWFLSINLNRFVQRNLISKNKTDIFMNIMLVATK